MSLLKFSHVSLADIDTAISAMQPTSPEPDDVVASSIIDRLSLNTDPSASDANLVYYVAGAVARSIVRCLRCDSCRELLTEKDRLQEISVDECLTYSAAEFLTSLNRGGLTKPTNYALEISLVAWMVFEEIRSNESVNKVFLCASSHRSLFVRVVELALSSEELFIESKVCENGHDTRAHMLQHFFNCLAKNLVRNLTSVFENSAGRKRKAAKLTGCSSSY